jgi:AcrR family transcriptional regulator
MPGHVTPATQGTPDPGTPAWWASRPAPHPARPRRGRPPRSFERIVDAAAELVDDVGPGAFNMRLLARRLDTSTATLYRHVSGKDELMAYVVDRLLGEVVADPELKHPRTWQDAAERIALQLYRALSRHPNVLPLLAAQVPVGPNGLAARERTIGTLVQFGFPPALAARAYNAVARYVLGFAVVQHAGGPGPQQTAALGDYFRTLDPELYPATLAAVDVLTEVPLEQEFLDGLRFILDGVDRAHPQR